jgi:NADPH2:quinone reductase
MRAVRIHAFGGPEVVTYEEIPQPVPQKGEVLFKVTSTCVNYADVQWRLGNYVDRTLPATLGREAAGIIAALGPGSPPYRWGSPSWPGRSAAMRNTPLPRCRTSSRVHQDWT